MTNANRTAIVAVGGNSLIVDEQHQSIPDQFNAAATTSHYVADMVEAGWTVVLTHGNGPQVGFILRRSGMAKGEVPEVPVDYADADTQGAIGYMFQRSLYNEFRRRGLARKVVDAGHAGAGRPERPRVQGPEQAHRRADGGGEGEGARGRPSAGRSRRMPAAAGAGWSPRRSPSASSSWM